MFIGQYHAVLDSGCGFVVPASYVKALSAGSVSARQAIAVCRGSVCIHPQRSFDANVQTLHDACRTARIQAEKKEMSAQLRVLTGSAFAVSWDEAGRMTLPPEGVSPLGLTPGDRLILRGLGDCFELVKTAP